MNTNDTLLARAQIGLSFLIACGFLGLLFVLLFHSVELTAAGTTIVTGLLSVLGTILTLQMNYFFARHRPQGLPDPPADDPEQPSDPKASQNSQPPASPAKVTP